MLWLFGLDVMVGLRRDGICLTYDIGHKSIESICNNGKNRGLNNVVRRLYKSCAVFDWFFEHGFSLGQKGYGK